MNRQDAKPAKEEPDHELDLLANTAIGAAIEVHRHLGPGYVESIYEEALAIEFRLRNLPFERQHPIGVAYKNVVVGQSRLDFLVGLRLVVEIKAVEHLLPVHRAQVISYLKATNCRLGLRINFHEATLARGVKRIVWTN
jgi:GxxExxY protein